MSTTTTISVNVPARRVATPRGAVLFGLVVNAIADRLIARKARVAKRREARDAAALYELARSLRDSSPSHAADLAAAADRAL